LTLGGVAFEQRKHDQALAYALEVRQIYEAVGDRSSVAMLDGNLALLSRVEGRYNEALAYNQSDLDYAVETADRLGEAVALGNRAHILWDAGQLDEALDCLARAQRIAEELGDAWEAARHLTVAAGIRAARNECEQALADYASAIPALRMRDAPFYLVAPLLNVAELMIETGELPTAREYIREGGQLATEMGLEDKALWRQILEARLDHADGDGKAALARLRQLAEQAADAEQQALARFWLWKEGRDEADRAVAVALYGSLHGQLPKYEYRMRLEALRNARG
jgi:ATP/maltotriose-dependent transcriptional regulator MalT